MEFIHSCMLIKPRFIFDAHFIAIKRDVLERFRRQKRGNRWIEIDPFGALDLPKRLPRRIEMVVHLCTWRRDQDAIETAECLVARYPLLDFRKNLVQKLTIAVIHFIDVQSIDPKPPGRDSFDDLRSGGVSDDALTPQFALPLCSHLNQRILFRGVPLDKVGQRCATEKRRFRETVIKT